MATAKPGKKQTWLPQLHCHDEVSLKDGCASVETYGDRTVELGGTSLCISNHGQAGGFGRQYFECRARKLKPIFAMEAYVNEARHEDPRPAIRKLQKTVKTDPGAKEKIQKLQTFVQEKFRPSSHAIIIARTRKGYSNLVRMSTDSWLKGFYYVPRTDTKFLAEHAEGLVYSTACIGGYIPKLAARDFDAGVKEAKRLQKIFGKDAFYVETMMTAYGKQRETNERMLKLAREVKAPVIVTCDVHYLKAEHQLAQRCLLLMRDRKTIAAQDAGEGGWQFDVKDLYWKTLEDVVACYKEHHADYFPYDDFKKAIKNTFALAESVNQWEFDTSPKLPGVYESPADTLKEIVIKGFKKKVEAGAIPASGRTKLEYAARVKHELAVINGKNFAEYFLILYDVCKHARKIGARVGPGRGSAGSSVVAYLCEITDIDPIRFDLLFERFLDASRPDLPDVDLDFSPEYRDRIKAFIAKRYPAVATIGTYATFKPRSTIQDVGRVFGVDPRETSAVTASLGTEADKRTWEEVLELFPSVKAWAKKNKEAWGVVATLKGLMSHRGKHAAGVLIAPASALDDLPLMLGPSSSEDGDPEIVTAIPDTQHEDSSKGRELSRFGYLKLDVLGVDTINVAPRAIEILARETGKEIVLEEIDLDDKKALQLAAKGDVTGAFQLDTPTSRPILQLVKPANFIEVAIVTALARPGPLDNKLHEEFARLKDTGDAWKKRVPKVVHRVMDVSRGLMIFQEDVMQVLALVGGMPMLEARGVIKAIGKKLSPEALNVYEAKFVEGGLKLGHDRKMLVATFQTLYAYTKYAFNKAHSCSYAISAVRQLYMLAHYPLYYFAGLLAEADRGKGKIPAYIRAALAKGIRVLPPSVFAQRPDFDIEHDEKGPAIRYGLTKIKTVSGAAEAIVEGAKGACDLETFLENVDRRRCNARVIQGLILAGAFDGVSYERGTVPEKLAEIEDPILRRNALIVRAAWYGKKPKRGETRIPLPKLYNLRNLILQEADLLGLPMSWWSSPLKDKIREERDLSTVSEAEEDDASRFGVLVEVTRLKVHKSRQGNMAFLEADDETGKISNIVIWARQWEEVKANLYPGAICAVYFRRKLNEGDRAKYGKYSYNLDYDKREPVVGFKDLRG